MRVVGGRYGLSSKEFTPAMIKAALDNIAGPDPKNHFTVGIHDDLSGTSLDLDEDFSVESGDVFRALFYGLGSDGTVGANKDSIKIIGDNTANYAQGYFVYDSKKAGAVTVSHLRFGPRPIRSSYLIGQAQFVGCHQPFFLERYEVLAHIASGGVFLLNTPYGPERIWEQLPEKAQRKIIERRVRFFAIDAHQVARECHMGGRINTIMQTCFFSISGVLPHDRAITAIKDSIRKTYAKKGEAIVQMNLAAVDQTLANLREVKVPDRIASKIVIREPVAGRRAVVCARRAWSNDRRPRRLRAGERSPVRRIVPDRHLAMGKAQFGGGGAGLGSRCLYPVQQVRDGVSACGNSQQSLFAIRARLRACNVQVARGAAARLEGLELYAPNRSRGLYGLRHLR